MKWAPRTRNHQARLLCGECGLQTIRTHRQAQTSVSMHIGLKKQPNADKLRQACRTGGAQGPKVVLAFGACDWHTETKVGLQSRGTTNCQVAGVEECRLPRQRRRPELTLDTLSPQILSWHGNQCPLVALRAQELACTQLTKLCVYTYGDPWAKFGV